MDKDSSPDPSVKTHTHSQAPARKRKRKCSWGSLKPRVLARTGARVVGEVLVGNKGKYYFVVGICTDNFNLHVLCWCNKYAPCALVMKGICKTTF